MTQWHEEARYLTKCIEQIDTVHDDRDINQWLTTHCTECDRGVERFSEKDKTLHRTYQGYVLVGCEGYWFINPVALGLRDEEASGWSDWTEFTDDDVADAQGNDQHFGEKYGTKQGIEDKMKGVDPE